MKVRLYNAISLDGFIAKKDGDSDWVSEADWETFEAEMQQAGCIVVGRKTFEQYQGELYPVEGILNIVMTKDESKLNEEGNVIYTNNNPEEIIQLAQDKNVNYILLIGGGNANASFIEKGLVDEVVVTVHPLLLGDGIRLFESGEIFQNLEKLSVSELADDLIQIIYKVKKS